MADIKTESDFQAKMVDGPAWGALQVTPGDGSEELTLFKQHATTDHKLSWKSSGGQSSGGNGKKSNGSGGGNMGALIDYKTKKTLDVSSLSQQDLLRPWINIHIAEWVQSNEARTGSADPGDWSNLAHQMGQNGGRIAGINSGIKATFSTGLGTWLAGPSADDGYRTSGDKGSGKYIETVKQGLSYLYNGQVPDLDKYTVHQGLIDFHT